MSDTASMTVELTPAPTGEIVKIDTHGLPATTRCCRCGAQAYVEVEVWDEGKPHLNFGLSALRPGSSTKRRLEFCGHCFGHTPAGKAESTADVLVRTAVRIVDYRPYLEVLERNKTQERPPLPQRH